MPRLFHDGWKLTLVLAPINWTPELSFISGPMPGVKERYSEGKGEIEDHHGGEMARLESIFVSRPSRKAVDLCQCYANVIRRYQLISKVSLSAVERIPKFQNWQDEGLWQQIFNSFSVKILSPSTMIIHTSFFIAVFEQIKEINSRSSLFIHH